jgi:hypothetical protein
MLEMIKVTLVEMPNLPKEVKIASQTEPHGDLA